MDTLTNTSRRHFLELTAVAAIAVLLGRTARSEPSAGIFLTSDYDQVPRVYLDTTTNINIVEALYLRLNQSLVPSKLYPLVIRAEILELNDVIDFPGQNITILARQIFCNSNALIRVRGGDGSGFSTPAPLGQNGRDGDHGIPGGNVIIRATDLIGNLTIDTSGGRGGNAQSGGTGDAGTPAADPGKPGGKGHMGGRAGTPGAGGDSGSIVVAIQNGYSVKSLKTIQGPGRPGDPGKNGTPGAGGDGGPASHQFVQTGSHYCYN